MKLKYSISILVLMAFLMPSFSFAHSGRTDSSGCHTCRTNCPNWGLDYGEYHCHRSKGVTQPLEPVRSIRNEGGVGQTVPAPEYKIPASAVSTPTINTTQTPSTQTEKKNWIVRFFSWLF